MYRRDDYHFAQIWDRARSDMFKRLLLLFYEFVRYTIKCESDNNDVNLKGDKYVLESV